MRLQYIVDTVIFCTANTLNNIIVKIDLTKGCLKKYVQHFSCFITTTEGRQHKLFIST